MNGTLITTTPRGGMHPLAVQGIPALDRHAQITDLLRSRLGEAYALLFAEPVFDPDRNVVDWYTPAASPPVPLEMLDEAARDAVRERLGQMAGDIRALAEELTARDAENGRNVAGEILTAALFFPDEKALYLSGEQPVVILWGCAPPQAGVEPRDLSRLARRTLLPATPSASVASDQAAASVDVQGRTVQRGGRFPWWLLLALLLLALALALWFTDAVPFLHPRKDTLNTERTLSLPETIHGQSDVRFLAGTWRCDTGLVDSSGVPVAVVYTFDERGEGVISITGITGDTPCQGKTKSSLDTRGVLTIETDPDIACPSGQSFRGQTVECRRIGANTQCRGRNRGSETEWEAVFIQQ